MRCALAVGLLGAVLLTGCSSSPARHQTAAVTPPLTATPGATPSVPAVTQGTPARAAFRLDRLRIEPRTPPTGYLRRDFGTSWRDTDGNGCNQRDDVLLRDAVPGTVRLGRQGRCDHDVLAGTWHDPYTGRTIVLDDLKAPHQAQAVQIDHVVPLAEAWASGASSWTLERRKRFANSLAELLAVDGPTNESKGDGDPAAWRPRKGFQCTYALRWIAVKHQWRLSVDPSEVRALREMLGYC